MQIVFVIPYFYDAWAYGGQPRSAYAMAKGLTVRGHRVKVLTTDSLGDHRLTTDGAGHSVRHVDGIEIHYYRNLSNYLAFRHRVFWPRRLFKDLNQQIRDAQVIHIHELRSFPSVAAASAASRLSIPYALSPHGGLRLLGKKGIKRIFDALWGKRIVRKAAAVIAISPIEEKDAAAFHVEDKRLFRVPNSVSAADFHSMPPAGTFRRSRGLSASRLVLFLGRLHPVKGADMLVEAFAKLCHGKRDTETQLIVAGPDDGQERELRETAIRLGVQERVTFTGYLDQKQKIEALVDSSLVVVPSRSEVFAITAVEALMCSRPVLLSSACGLYPAPDESHGVRLFDSTSVEDLTSKLQGALNDAELSAAARNGRDFVLREFSLEGAAIKLESVYQAIGADR